MFKILFALLISSYLLPAEASYFDKHGTYLDDAQSADDPRIGWQLAPYSALNSGVLTLSSRPKYLPTAPSYFFYCSGSLVSSRSATSDSPVYILTNGHCVAQQAGLDEFDLGFVAHVTPALEIFGTVGNFFDFPKDQFQYLEVEEVSFAEMERLDIALLKTKLTLAQAEQLNFRVYHFAESSIAHQKVRNIGTPIENRTSEFRLLHESTCETFDTVTVFENPNTTLALRNTCSITGGMSGSPIFNENNEVGAIQFTGYHPASAPDIDDCELDRPCEVTPTGNKLAVGYSYAIPVHGLDACFDTAGFFIHKLCGL